MKVGIVPMWRLILNRSGAKKMAVFATSLARFLFMVLTPRVINSLFECSRYYTLDVSCSSLCTTSRCNLHQADQLNPWLNSIRLLQKDGEAHRTIAGFVQRECIVATRINIRVLCQIVTLKHELWANCAVYKLP